ncbi:nucleotidyltransferase domain-containing protein [Schlegelella sp. S2-27]|uniref:Nucleotidyltransferase domain-containing protein n=1 Tax=Caldimonas mangrovi TaxID=2944811 RepID=A0ABT0YMA9_9BURK|nr:nucleotidyltransferase domain-containing protein [Caldimonas mangrovi]MCM5679559.1 nucleotidyltransferase domain-containing protein [Caldimonas mangrovi]
MLINFETITLPEGAMRQYIDARQAFTALEQLRPRQNEFRGGMVWRTSKGHQYLVRTSPGGAQKGLGRRSPETEAIYDKFVGGKQRVAEIASGLRDAIKRHERVNRALYVGRTPRIIVELLAAVEASGLSSQFIVIGTNALYAYETAAGVRLDQTILATQDLDLLWDNRKTLSLAVQEGPLAEGMLGLLRKVDPTFELRRDQLYTAVNSKGYEIDILRRLGPGSDEQPRQLKPGADDFWAVQARNSDWLLSAPKFSEVIVSETGGMARMHTVDPRAFALFKLWMAQDKEREARKRQRDGMQARAVIELIEERLPQLRFEDIHMFPAEVRKQAEAVTQDIAREMPAGRRTRTR